jgi:hypothetical protein
VSLGSHLGLGGALLFVHLDEPNLAKELRQLLLCHIARQPANINLIRAIIIQEIHRSSVDRKVAFSWASSVQRAKDAGL